MCNFPPIYRAALITVQHKCFGAKVQSGPNLQETKDQFDWLIPFSEAQTHGRSLAKSIGEI